MLAAILRAAADSTATTVADAVESSSGLGIEFGFHNVNSALLLMLLGMVGIFTVMLILLGSVALMNKLTSHSEETK